MSSSTTPQLLSLSTIETIKNTTSLYNNINFKSILLFTNSTPTSSTINDLQLIGSLDLSTCQPLSIDYSTSIQTILDELIQQREPTPSGALCNTVVYFTDSENKSMIGHFINHFIIVYIT
ncbi:hypothetical protein SBY92_000801 [Candida maltosa Xu316]